MELRQDALRSGSDMSAVSSTSLQIILAWRANKWVVEKNAEEVGSYAYRSHAMARVRSLAGEARRLGLDCYLLVRDEHGHWEERPCPRPWRTDPRP
jgi:hypothetical protein